MVALVLQVQFQVLQLHTLVVVEAVQIALMVQQALAQVVLVAVVMVL
jgi:hypothetical protein